MALGKSRRVIDLNHNPMILITQGIPITLMGLYGEQTRGFEQVNLEMQTKLLSLSTNARQIFAKQSNYNEISAKQTDLVIQAMYDGWRRQ